MSYLFRQLFRENDAASTTGQPSQEPREQLQATSGTSKHPPIVHLSRSGSSKKNSDALLRNDTLLNFNDTQKSEHDLFQDKRPASELEGLEDNAHKRRRTGDSNLPTLAGGIGDAGPPLAKRLRAPSDDAGSTLVKRAKRDVSEDVDRAGFGILDDHHSADEHDAGPLTRQMHGQNDRKATDIDAMEQIFTAENAVCNSVSAIESKSCTDEPITKIRCGDIGGLDLDTGMAKNHSALKLPRLDNNISRSTAGCPSGGLVGVGLWPSCCKVPGDHKADRDKSDEKEIIQLPEQRIRQVEPEFPVIIRCRQTKCDSQGKPSNAIQLPPLFVPRRTETQGYTTASERRLKAKKRTGGSSQTKLGGLWGRNIGPDMSPRKWTG